MAEVHRWRQLSVSPCKSCGQMATMSYSLILDGESQGTEYYCATCANVKIDAITSAPKPPRGHHSGKNHSKLGAISDGPGSPYARNDGQSRRRSKTYYKIPKAH